MSSKNMKELDVPDHSDFVSYVKEELISQNSSEKVGKQTKGKKIRIVEELLELSDDEENQVLTGVDMAKTYGKWID